MKTSIFRNLKIGFGISIIILLLSSIASFTSINKLNENSELVRRTDDILLGLENIMSHVKDAETGQRGYLLTHDVRFLEPYTNAYPKVIASYDRTAALIQDRIVQQDMVQLKSMIEKRFGVLRSVLKKDSAAGINTRNIREITGDDLYDGKFTMGEIRRLTSKMEDRENSLLAMRTGEQEKYAVFTPILIVVAALISLFITIFAYFRVKSDFDKRTALQDETENKAIVTGQRISIIKELASDIAGGDYSVRVEDKASDDLGNLAGSLNGMAASLETSFAALTEREWLQTGIGAVNDTLSGEKNLGEITQDILSVLANYTIVQVGAFYITQGRSKTLELCTTYASEPENHQKLIPFGEKLIGQAAQSQKIVFLENIPEKYISISSSLGSANPASLVIIPITLYGKTVGVMELASLSAFKEKEKELFRQISLPIGTAIVTVQNRAQVQKLLGETQAQSEELQNQQIEMEKTNAELEMQTQKLQASEEELKVQQEELIQTNGEIEEKSQLLEEQNQLIIEKNIDLEFVSRENERKAQELALSSKYKSEFLANMSHELRTPLNSILLLSQLLAKNNSKNLDAEQVEFASVINLSGKGLLELINEILDLSKIESGKMTIDFEDVLLKDITYSIRSIFDSLASEKSLNFTITVDENLPENIRTDTMRIEQVLKNFLSNAFKFTDEGTVALKIFASPAETVYSDVFLKGRDVIAFAVKDSGIGIPKDKQQLVFEAFQQADGSTKRKYGGTGLGLSISREIAKMLGGEVQLHSEEGDGSTFTLYVPVNSEAALLEKAAFEETEDFKKNAAVAEIEETHNQYALDTTPSEIADDRGSITAKDKVILIVEDDTNFAKALLKFTNERGYKGVVAVRGDLGVEFALQFNPVAILLDIQLPVMDGWTVMAALKENPATKHIPVHMMSSMELKKESLLKGAVNFISKPVASTQIENVFQGLEEVMNKHDKKVLIIEDNARQAEMLSEHLRQTGATTSIAKNMDEAVGFLNNETVDCVILDMSVADVTAYDVLEKIKENPQYETLPIIVYTGNQLSKQEELKIKKYASAIIVKTETSYKRLLTEVDLFLHKVAENPGGKPARKKLHIGDKALHGKNVLIVDDDARNLFSLTKSLEQQRMTVLGATDGQEALALLKNSVPDIILLDIMMPEMDGYDTLRAIRNDPAVKNIPVIVLTAKTMQSEREKSIQAGASDFLTKPVDFDKLLSLMRVWLYR